MKKKSCYNCEWVGFTPKYGRSSFVEMFLLITTWWLLWLPLVFYYALKPKWVCPRCFSKV